MATYSFIHIDLQEGTRLCDLFSIQYDLGRCRAMCAAFTSAHDYAVRDALSVAIPTVYGRIFLGGVRDTVRLPTETLLSPDDIAFHNTMLALRSKHVAHSVNSMETQRLRVWLNPPEKGGRKVNNVNAESVTVGPFAFATYQKLSDISAIFLTWVNDEMSEESRQLKKLVEERYSLDELYAMEAGPSDCGDVSDINRGRSRPGKSHNS